MPKPLSVLVEAVSGKRSATDGEQDGQKGRRKHIKSQPGGTKDDAAGGTSSGQQGSAKGANKSTDAKLHNAVLKTLCVLSQQVREVRGAVFMCWMIKQEAPARVQETERAIARLLRTSGDQGQGSRPRFSRDSGFHGPNASAVGALSEGVIVIIQERIVFSVKLHAELWNGHCQQRSNRIEKSEFCCSITSRLTNQIPIATG